MGPCTLSNTGVDHGRTDQSGRTRVAESANAKLFNPILTIEMILGGGKLEPALIAESKLIHHGGSDHFGVAAGKIHLSLIVPKAEARIGVGRIGIGILETEAAEYGIAGRELMVQPGAELIEVGIELASVQEILARIAVAADRAGHIGQRQIDGVVQNAIRIWP